MFTFSYVAQLLRGPLKKMPINKLHASLLGLYLSGGLKGFDPLQEVVKLLKTFVRVVLILPA